MTVSNFFHLSSFTPFACMFFPFFCFVFEKALENSNGLLWLMAHNVYILQKSYVSDVES